MKARIGDRVRVQYVGLPGNGKPLSGAPRRQVLDFTVGSPDVMPAINRAVVGMVRGEEKRLTASAADAYGEVDPKLIKEVSRQHIAEHVALHVGKKLVAVGERSRRRHHVRVVEIWPETVVLDGNHPLAGQTLEIELLLVSIRSQGASN